MSPVVWHLVDAMGAGEELWGKERVIADVVAAQRERGIDAGVISFAPSGLSRYMRHQGLPVKELEDVSRRIPRRSLPALVSILRARPGAVLHTHGYKANVVGRLARLLGAPIARLVATCHGWPDETPATRRYNALDRWSSFLSDTTTVPDPAMLGKFPRIVRGRAVHVANAIPDSPRPTASDRATARKRFGLADGNLVAGTLGRFSEEKGIPEALRAAADPRSDGIVWAFGGSGPLEWCLRESGPRVRCVGYVHAVASYFAALDVFVQTSRSEGLSLALLEAMRAALPIVATDVGATSYVLRDGHEAILVPAYDPNAIVDALVRLRDDPALRRVLGDAARARFESEFRVDRVVRDFLHAYGRG
ncbi:MAG: glycosyl transferase group 1 [Candidatus Eremiobacteraeota bacterium]|nr:glycosyl transferase group 1 [Candidatus Eremiobacteraeota bacterium]